MDKAAIELALRDAGVAGRLSVALAADLSEPMVNDADLEGEFERLVPGRRAHRMPPDGRGAHIEHRWAMPILADADLCGGFGDLCGRRVA